MHPAASGRSARRWPLALFDGGARRAQTDAAVAAYDAAVAQYKRTVLAGFQEVEDNLAALRVLAAERTVQDAAVAAARLAERASLAQYRAGTATYLAVVTSQTLLLSNQRSAVQLLGRQLVASAALVKAIGGGWNAAELAGAAADSATRTGGGLAAADNVLSANTSSPVDSTSARQLKSRAHGHQYHFPLGTAGCAARRTDPGTRGHSLVRAARPHRGAATGTKPPAAVPATLVRVQREDVPDFLTASAPCRRWPRSR